MWQCCPNLCHFWFRRFRLLVCFCLPPELFVPQCDYNLTLQETGRVQGLKTVRICQSEFAAAAAVEGERWEIRLSASGWRLMIIVDICPTYFFPKVSQRPRREPCPIFPERTVFWNPSHILLPHIVFWQGSLPGIRGAMSTGQEWISQFPKRL